MLDAFDYPAASVIDLDQGPLRNRAAFCHKVHGIIKFPVPDQRRERVGRDSESGSGPGRLDGKMKYAAHPWPEVAKGSPTRAPTSQKEIRISTGTMLKSHWKQAGRLLFPED